MNNQYLTPPVSAPARGRRTMEYGSVTMVNRNTIRTLADLNFMTVMLAEAGTGRLLTADFDIKISEIVKQYDHAQVGHTITKAIIDILTDVASMHDINLSPIDTPENSATYGLNSNFSLLQAHVTMKINHLVRDYSGAGFTISNQQQFFYNPEHQPLTMKFSITPEYSLELVETTKPMAGLPTITLLGKKMVLVVHYNEATFAGESMVGLMTTLDKNLLQVEVAYTLKATMPWLLKLEPTAKLTFTKTTAKDRDNGAAALTCVLNNRMVQLMPASIPMGYGPGLPRNPNGHWQQPVGNGGMMYGPYGSMRHADRIPAVPVGSMGGTMQDLSRVYASPPSVGKVAPVKKRTTKVTLAARLGHLKDVSEGKAKLNVKSPKK